MGNPDIKDFINQLDDNKENNDHIVDGKEVQLLNSVLSDAEQIKELQEILLQEGNLKKVMKLITNGIDNQNDIQSLDYYESFISSFELIQDFHPDDRKLIESAKQKIQDQKNTINKKNDELAKKKIEKVENIQNTIINNELSNKLNLLSEKDFVKFKDVLNSLKKWEIWVEQMDPLDTMTQIIKAMANMDKASVLSEFDKLLSEKFPEKKTDPELASFKDILSGLLDNKSLLNQFVETVDRDLKWLSYNQLLEQAKDPKSLESAEVNKSINTIFHMEKNWFDHLLKDFDDPIKQNQVTSILKKYYELHGKVLPEWAMFEKSQTSLIVDKLPVQVDCFKIKWTDEVIYYWELDTGKSMNFEQVAKISWVSEALGIDNVTQLKKLDPRIWEIMKNNTIQTPSGKKMSFGDAFSAFFSSSFFDQLKQAFYSLMATFWEESEQERYIIESNYVLAKNDVRQWWNFSYTDKENEEQVISYISVLNKFEPGFDKNENINYKKLFTEASVTIQKSYIETCMSKGKEAWYNILKSNIPLIEANKVEKEQKVLGKEFVSWSVIDELKINKDAKGEVEKKWEWDNQYLLIDGQVIPLIDGKGSLFVQWTDGQIIEKNIIIDKKDNKENISISDWEKLDLWLLETIKKGGTWLLVWLWDPKRVQLSKYYMLEQSSIDDKENPINILMKWVSQLWPDQKDKAEIAIVKFKKAFIWQIEKKQWIWKVSDNLNIFEPFKDLKTELSAIVTANSSQQEKRNTVVNSRIQSWSS